MMSEKIRNEYFDWLSHLVSGKQFSQHISYRKLLRYLHNKGFRYYIPGDASRACDGVSLRWRFALDTGREESYDDITDVLSGPCSMLEMLISLAIRCEETIMDDPQIGDRMAQWFWGMIANLHLNSMMDNCFDIKAVNDRVERFLDRAYESDGNGGLFIIHNCPYDLREAEIWHQLCWYLDSIT